MKKLILKSMMLLSVLALTFTSCSDNDDKVVTTPVSLSIEMPLGSSLQCQSGFYQCNYQ